MAAAKAGSRSSSACPSRPRRGPPPRHVVAFGPHGLKRGPPTPAPLSRRLKARPPRGKGVCLAMAVPLPQRGMSRHGFPVDDDPQVGDILLQAPWCARLVGLVDVALPQIRWFHA